MAIVKADKGWFSVPGVRPKGDRTLAEQRLGLEPALAACRGKTVLDLGCAEALITREFAQAGAARVVGIELLGSHLEVAAVVCKGLAQVELIQSHLGQWINRHPDPEAFDIVLALGIIHKLDDPGVPLAWAARSAKDLLLFRAPAAETNGVILAKHTKTPCNVPEVLRRAGFRDEMKIKGVRGEAVQYWRRNQPPAASRQPSATDNGQLPTGGSQ